MTDETTQVSDETARLAALGRGDEPSSEAAPVAIERPEYIPEKFWDADKGEARFEDLARSYAELEKRIGAPKDDTPPANETGDEPAAGDDKPEGDEAGDEAAAAVLPAELFTGAQAEYAESGDLSAETREKIIAAGIDATTLDTYLAGVKALSDQLTQQVYATAGGEEQYLAAVEWARENWTPGQIEKFDAALNDADMRDPFIKGLMADFTAAGGVPSEGNLTRPGSGSINDGDLYTDPAEFTRDLAAADAANDTLARRKAVQKLERSRRAKTVGDVTPRSPLRL